MQTREDYQKCQSGHKGKKRRRNNKNAEEDLFMFHVMICEYLSHVNHVSHDLFRKPV